MKRMKFQEYLNSRGQVDKPVISVDGDRVDPMTPPVKPPKAEKGYVCSDGKPKKASGKGFGEDGDKSLKYVPNTSLNSKGKTPSKLPTVEQAGTLSLLVKSLQESPTFMEDVIRQFKANGLLGAVVAEMLSHRETFQHLSQIMAHESYGPDVCNKLVRAMNEEVAAPFHDQLEDDGSEEDHEDDDVDNNGDQSDGEGIHDEDPADDSIDVDMQQDTNEDPTLGSVDVDPMMNGDQFDPNMLGDQMGDVLAQHPAMQNFHKAMMRSMMRSMMSKI